MRISAHVPTISLITVALSQQSRLSQHIKVTPSSRVLVQSSAVNKKVPPERNFEFEGIYCILPYPQSSRRTTSTTSSKYPTSKALIRPGRTAKEWREAIRERCGSPCGIPAHGSSLVSRTHDLLAGRSEQEWNGLSVSPKFAKN